MRMTQLFSQTLRDIPSEAEVASHQLLLRAGFIRQLAAGVFSYLPLGRRTMDRLEAVIRQEMDAIGGQEISMPVVHPADLWKETGRWYKIDAEMGRFKDRSGRDLVLGMTHEEVVADLVRKEIRSYRQLPRLVYQIQTKWRDDPRPRAGLIRAREFTMKDSYSLDSGWEGLDRQYQAHYEAYFRIFQRCGLPVISVKSDVGIMGGQLAHEFMYLTPIGEDTLLLCSACGYSANRQVALFKKPAASPEQPLPVAMVPTPGAKTIDDLARFLEVPNSRTAKAVFMMAALPEDGDRGKGTAESKDQGSLKGSERFIFAIIRGDMEVNETKLANALKARTLRPATEEEIRATGAVPGYASPVGLDPQRSSLPVTIIVDDAIPGSPNLVAGANREGFHLLNTNCGRDYRAEITADIAAAQEGDACPDCGHPLRAERGVELGNIFKLGTWFSEALGCTFLDQEGQPQPVIMGSYGIGIGRLMACIAEEHHDEKGLVWPAAISPYEVHLVVLAGRKETGGGGKTGTGEPVQEGTEAVAARLYEELQADRIEVLFDDRNESPGVKFNDADLIGLPLRITVSDRALKSGGVELKRRDRDDREVVPLNQAIGRVKDELSKMM